MPVRMLIKKFQVHLEKLNVCTPTPQTAATKPSSLEKKDVEFSQRKQITCLLTSVSLFVTCN